MAFLNFPKRREIAWQFDFVLEDGDVTAILRRPWRFYGAPWRSIWRLLALSRRFHCMHRVVTARALRVHGAPTALTAFCHKDPIVTLL